MYNISNNANLPFLASFNVYLLLQKVKLVNMVSLTQLPFAAFKRAQKRPCI